MSVLGFFLGLYLADTLLAPYFYISHLWVAIVLALVMGAANSTNKPFRGFKTNKGRAFGFFGLTVLVNYLILQITALIFDSLSGNPIAIMLTAVFLTLVAALLNNAVGFKPVEQPKVVTRDHGLSDSTRDRMTQTDARTRQERRRGRPS